jgi:hypothetical protein
MNRDSLHQPENSLHWCLLHCMLYIYLFQLYNGTNSFYFRLCITSYVAYDSLFLNILFAGLVIIPKTPHFHKVRLFGINAD